MPTKTKNHYSVRIEGRARKTSFKGSKRTVYKKLHKAGYSYSFKNRKWTISKKSILTTGVLATGVLATEVLATEISIYGLMISLSDSNDYINVDTTFYVEGVISPQQVLAEINNQGYKLIRSGSSERVTVAGRYVSTNKSLKTLVEGIKGLVELPIQHYERNSKPTVRANNTSRDLYKKQLKAIDNEVD